MCNKQNNENLKCKFLNTFLSPKTPFPNPYLTPFIQQNDNGSKNPSMTITIKFRYNK